MRLSGRLPAVVVNYVRESRRASPFNLAAARVLLGTYLLWNVGSLDLGGLAGWHVYLSRNSEYMLLNAPAVQRLLPAERALLLIVLLAFVVGYRERLAAFVAALLVAHIAVVLATYSYVGRVNSLFFAAYFLLFFALYAETDHLSVDTLLARTPLDRPTAARRLTGSPGAGYDMRILQLTLFTVAVLYFGSAWAKVVLGGDGLAWAWLGSANLGRWTVSSLLYWEPPTALGGLMLRYPVLLSGAAVGTVVLEAALLVAVLLGVGVTPVVVGLVGMHTVITLALGPFFLDQYVFLALFVPWDDLYRRVAPTTAAVVAVDTDRLHPARLLPLALLDPDGGVAFRTADDDRAALRVTTDDGTYTGGDAAQVLLGRYPVARPLAWLLDRPLGRRVLRRAWRALGDTRREPARSGTRRRRPGSD